MQVLISFLPQSDLPLDFDSSKFDEIIYISERGFDLKELKNKWIFCINNFSSIQINEEEKILDSLQYGAQLNIWFLSKREIYYSKKAAFYELCMLSEHLNDTDGFHIISNKLTADLFQNKNISVSSFHPKSNANRVSQFRKLFNFAKYSIAFICRFLISKKLTKKTPKHFLHGYPVNEILIPSIKKPTQKANINSIWGYFAEQHHQDFSFIEDAFFHNIEKNFEWTRRVFSTKHPNTYTNEYIWGRSFFNKKINKEVKLISLKINNNLLSTQDVLYKPEDILIINTLLKLRKSHKILIRKHLAYRHFFENSKAKTITTYAENFAPAKTILDAAKAHSIKTIGLQHGVIGFGNMGYTFSAHEAQRKPMPDLTLAWGAYGRREIIESGHYKAGSVRMVGQQRTDIISKIKSQHTRNPRQITFFTQPQPDQEERYLSAKSFVSIAKKVKDISFVIKVHPAEKEDLYLKLISEIKPDKLIIERQKDTYQVLSESGLTVTCYSTVGIESLYFDTPLVSFDSKGTDLAAYLKNDVAHWAKNEAELLEIISQFKNNTLEKKNTEEFIENFSYKIDGQVCSRIRNEIMGSST